MSSWNINVPQSEYYGPLPHNPRGIYPGDPGPLIRELEDTPLIAIDSETTGLDPVRDHILYWSLAWNNRRATVHASLLPWFRHILAQKHRTWVLANAKYDMHMFANMGCPIEGAVHCTQVMHSLLFDDKPHKLKWMAQHLLGWRWSDFQDTFGKITEKNPPINLIRKAEAENFPLLVEYAANDAWGTLGVYWDLLKKLQEAETHSLYREMPPHIETLWDLFSKVEAPYTRVLWKNERNGIMMDVEYLARIQPQAEREIEKLESDITREVGWLINMKSPDQMRRYFIEQCGIAPLKMTKGGQSGNRQASIDEDFLEYASEELGNKAAGMMLEHRNLTKLHGTYITGIGSYIDAYHRIHTRFNQDITRTGRLSSADPNLWI
jgi:DNA polymerase-1